MLIGQFSSNLSKGNRIALPKKFRDELGSEIIIAKWYENCLVMVSTENWQKLVNKLTGRAQTFTKPVRDTDRFILGSAFELVTDDQGRTVLPSTLIDYAGLTKEAVFLGLGDRVEIWDKQNWVEKERNLTVEAASQLETLANENNS